jgi:hypothetical protein
LTYRTDSDIQWDYGKFIEIESNEIIAPSKSPRWRKPDEDFFGNNFFEFGNIFAVNSKDF